MPTSFYEAIPNVLRHVKALQPKSILDIGVGFGKYGLLMRDLLEIPFGRYEKDSWEIKIDGVEAFEGYHNPIYNFAYNQVYFGDILSLIDTLPRYDCIILIDVIEHFSKEDGLVLVEKLVSHCNKGVILTTPLYPDQQGKSLINKFEQHKSLWSIVDFKQFSFIYERAAVENNGTHIFIIKQNTPYKKMSFEKLMSKKQEVKSPLSIAYFLPHKNLTGGMKMLLQQMKYLKERGHRIIACMKDSNQQQSVLPDWFDLVVDEEITVPEDELLVEHIPVCDVIVSGWMTQLLELRDSKIPVLYWEQGNEWLFGDIKDQKHLHAISVILEQCYLTKHAIISVSPYVYAHILARYGRKTPILTNGIDTNFYCKGEKSNTNKILLVGNPHLLFKGFDCAFKALTLAWTAGYRFQVEWVCQTIPQCPKLPFPIVSILHPTQEELVKCYQCADMLVFTSWYEGFGMPPLEAMSCGTAVVCTKCGGIDAFAEHGYNAMLSETGDITSLTTNIAALLKYPQLRSAIGENGRKTAENLDYSKVILVLEEYLYSIVEETEEETTNRRKLKI